MKNAIEKGVKDLKNKFGSLRGKGKGRGRGNTPYEWDTVDWDLKTKSYYMFPPERLANGDSKNSVIIHGKGLLSPADCKMLIDKAEELGLDPVDTEYSKDYRDCKRLVVKAPQLAATLWRRVASILSPSNLVNVRPYGFDNEGFWAPLGLNSCLRIVKYDEGGHFEPHKDGAFVLDDDTRSIYTLQIYLNEGYEGGLTVFFDDDSKPQQEISGSEGAFLIFNHDVLHQGTQVTGNVPKYILRMDLMFKREPTDRTHQRSLLLKNPDFLRMDELYKKSIRLQEAGDPKGSTQAYLEAQKIQASFPSIQQQSSDSGPPPLGWSLGFDISLQIFELLSLSQLARAARVCRGWNTIVSSPTLWRKLYFRRWPQIAKVEALIDISPHLLDYMKPWREAYVQRLRADDNFRVIFFDLGSQTTRFGIAGEPDQVTRPASYYMYSHYPPDGPAIEPPEIPSIVARVLGHYWSAREGLEDYLVGPEVGNSYYRTYNPQTPFTRSPKNPDHFESFRKQCMLSGNPEYEHWHRGAPDDLMYSSDNQYLIHWDVIRNLCKFIISAGFGSTQATIPHPLLFALPAFFRPPEERLLEYMARNKLESREVAFVSSSVLVLLATGRKTGLVVSSGHMVTTVTPVVEGSPIFSCETFFPHAGLELAPHKKKSPENLEAAIEDLFFNPTNPAHNLAQVVLVTVLKCEEKHRQELLDHLVLCGGNTFDIEARFRKDFAALVYPTPYKATIKVPEDRLTAVAYGAKLYCSYSGVAGLFA